MEDNIFLIEMNLCLFLSETGINECFPSFIYSFFKRIFQTHEWGRELSPLCCCQRPLLSFASYRLLWQSGQLGCHQFPEMPLISFYRHFGSRVRSGMQHFWPVSMLIFYLMAHKSKSGLGESWSTHYMVINSLQRQAVLQGVTAPPPLPPLPSPRTILQQR